LAANIQKGEVFKRAEPQMWLCRNCGFVFEGTEAPALCPACQHPQSFYEIYPANY
jgi:rubrerythrin